MPSVLKSVSYSFIEGYAKPFSFDAICIEGGKVTLDVHKTFRTREDFYAAVESVIPVFEDSRGGDPVISSLGEVQE